MRGLRAGQSKCRNALFNRITDTVPRRMASSPEWPPRTAARCWHAGVRAEEKNSLSATRGKANARLPQERAHLALEGFPQSVRSWREVFRAAVFRLLPAK